MLVYLLMFALFPLGALAVGSQPPARQRPALLISSLFLIVLIGLRYRVGCDWIPYLKMLDRASGSFSAALTITDPGYGAINWVAAQVGAGIWAVNTVCAIIFVIGLARLCRAQPNPPLAMLVAIPYLVIVVAMAYTRQSAALGLMMLAITQFQKRSYGKMTVAMLAAMLFHKSAIIALPVFGLAASGRRPLSLLAFIILTAAAYYFFVAASVSGMFSSYIEAGYASSGALVRVLMNFVPALLFLIFRRRWQMDDAELHLWTLFSLASVASVAFLIVSPSSTAVDRAALYLIPLQVVVLSRIANIFGSGRASMLLVVFVIIYSLGVEIIWVSGATHAHCWIPYRNFLWSAE